MMSEFARAIQDRGAPILLFRKATRDQYLSTTESAALLTRYAIERHLISERSAIHGNTLASWFQRREKQTPPFWAVTAAVMWLEDHQWQPHDNKEWALWAFVMTKRHPAFDNPNAFAALLPEGWPPALCRHWLSKSLHHRQLNAVSRKDACSPPPPGC